LITLTALELLEPLVAGAAVLVPGALDAGGFAVVPLLVLLHAAVMNARPRTGTSKTRDRIGAPPYRSKSQMLC
jgi:hypothetical protein